MAEVFVGIGSNLQPRRWIAASLRCLRARYGSLRISPVYESVPMGLEGGNFLNLVVFFETSESPRALQENLHGIEAQNGRRRNRPGDGSRTLDLDLLLYDDLLIDEPGLTIPRPDSLRYAFVLRPLADLAPERRHPLVGKSFGQLWREFPATQSLWPLEPQPVFL